MQYRPTHITGWPSYLRPAVLLYAAVHGLVVGTSWLWIGAVVAMGVEIYWWLPRFTVVAWRRQITRRHAVIAALAAWLINPARILIGLGRGWWWLFGWPITAVNRQRLDNARARHLVERDSRRAARAAKLAATGTTVRSVVTGAVVRHRHDHPELAAPEPAPAPSRVLAMDEATADELASDTTGLAFVDGQLAFTRQVDRDTAIVTRVMGGPG